MPKINRALHPQSIWDENALGSFLEASGYKASHAQRICKHLLATGADSLAALDGVPNLPDKLPALLRAEFALCTSRVQEAFTSADGTIKLLVELQDGLTVESVVIPNGATTGDAPVGNPRVTLCVSSQIGCKMGCTFCATGTMGEIGHLSAGEIVEQLWHANRYKKVRNVVFMGMGEPLNNYGAVRAAVAAMTDVQRFRLAPSCVTVSTVGVIPRILDLARDLPKVNLALSLHAPTQELRKRFVPSSSGAPLPKLMAAIDAYMDATGRKVLVEYCLLAGENDQPEHAASLAALMSNRDITLNLIPYNPTYNPRLEQPHAAPTAAAVAAFQDALFRAGVRTTVRKEKGQDISGACGQLVVGKEQQQGHGGGGVGCAGSSGGGGCSSSGSDGGGGGGGSNAGGIKPSGGTMWGEDGPVASADDIEDLLAGFKRDASKAAPRVRKAKKGQGPAFAKHKKGGGGGYKAGVAGGVGDGQKAADVVMGCQAQQQRQKAESAQSSSLLRHSATRKAMGWLSIGAAVFVAALGFASQ